MSAEDRGHSARLVRQQTGEIAFSTAIGAALMLLVGFVVGLRGISDSEFYNFTVSAFTWMMKVGGVVMAIVAVLLWMGIRPALMVDAILACAIGVLMVAIGAIWVANQTLLNGFLLVIFGIMFVRSGWNSWVVYGGSSGGGVSMIAAEAGASPPPVAVVDPDAQKQAMERLLASKKREMPAEPAPPMRKPVPKALRALEQTPPPVQAPPRVPDQVPPLAKHEPPPEGFLAELGRDDTKQDL